MSDSYNSHTSVLSAYEWVQMNGINPEIENSLYLDDILIQASDELQAFKARVKELEAELSKLKKAYDVVSAYATHFTPDHKLEDKLKEENKAYE